MTTDFLSETEVLMFWKIALDARRSRSARDARFALDELQAMAMHTTSPALRERCVAVLGEQRAVA